MYIFRRPVDTIRENVRQYLAFNLLYFGLVAASMVYVVFYPEIQSGLIESVSIAIEKVPWVVDAYTSGNFPMAAVLTLLINLVLASFVYITLPSLIIPFGGIILGCVRAIGWGLILAPTSSELVRAMTTHSLVIFLEGEGYVIAMLAAYLFWKGVLWPERIGEKKRLKAYLTGIEKTAYLYVLVTIVLAVSAIYEAFEIIYILGYNYTTG